MHSTTAATSVSPRELFSKICGKWKIYSGFQQQDSHELLRRLLDELSEEAKKMETYMPNGSDSQVTSSFSSSSTTDPTVAKKPQSFVEHVFQGQLASLIVCNECGYVRNKGE